MGSEQHRRERERFPREAPAVTPTAPRIDSPEQQARHPPARRAPPRTLRHYDYEGALGAGGMGYVYRYRDRKLQRSVAIKLVRDRQDREQILREARAAARVQHPCVVAIYEVDEVDGFIVTEYIAGQRLDTCPVPMPLPALLPLVRDIASGLAAVHDAGMIHGDIKPANILIDAGTGRPKLIDFGLARHQGSDRGPAGVAGTPPYTAPELWAGQPPSPAADVFAFGVLLHLLGTGALPPPGAVAVGAGLPPEVRALIERCLAPESHLRPQDGQHLVERLARIAPATGDATGGRAEPARETNPYLGLRPFDYEHRALFFGRGSDIERIAARLRQQRLVVITGESGVGKSSLARAGVRPRLHDCTWTELRPAPDPLGSIASLLAGALGAPAAVIEALVRQADWPGLARYQPGPPPGRPVVWFFDQLEELLVLDAQDEIEGFARALAWAIDRVPQVHVLATARSDAFARLAYLPALGKQIEQGACLLRPLDRSALAEAIVEPARRVGLGFEPESLVDALIDAADGMHGGLPLLQATLVELWVHRDRARNVMARRGYEALGGLTGAITRHADRVYESLVPDKRRRARRILLRLVEQDPVAARRRAWRPGEVAAGEREVLARLVAERLVVARERDGAPSYELAHDCLVSRWGQLRRWLNEEGDRQVTRQRLARDAAEWAREQRSPDMLWSKRQLAAAHALDPGELPAAERAFLAASRGRIRRTRLARAAVALGVLALVALAGAAFRYQAARHIDRQLAVAAADHDRVRDAAHQARARYEAMVARLHADPLDERALDAWPRLLADLAGIENGLREVNMRFDAVLALAPGRDPVRRAAAALVGDRIRLAHFLDRPHEVDELEDKLRAYGPGLGHGCGQPIPIALHVQPAAAVLVHRYQLDSDGRAVPVRAGEHAPGDPGLALAPGSYLLTVPADREHAALRQPLWLDCEGAPVALTLIRPRQATIPPGFVYVPAGTVRYGFGRNREQELIRPWFETTPLHERHVDAFFIARHETSFGQWIEFLDACRQHACAGIVARPPRVGTTAPGESPLQLVQGQDGWILELRVDPEEGEGIVLRAAQGQALSYPGRVPQRQQAWERMPVTGVAWDDVQAYLRWLGASGRVPGARLCREDEWERAARGADGRLYPHGNVLHPGDANFDMTYGRKALAYGLDEVGTHPASASPFGIHDLAGNAWEMVTPWGWDGNGKRMPVLRGGSFYHSALDAVAVNRWVIERHAPDSRVGFRVCAPAPAAQP